MDKNNKNVIIAKDENGKEVEYEVLFEFYDEKNKKNYVGYTDNQKDDFDNILDNFDKIIGLDKLKCIHINDSKNIMASHKDRHENIGLGYIGFNNLLNVIYNKKLEDVPKILETPYVDKTYPPYKYEIEMIKAKKFNENLIEECKQH